MFDNIKRLINKSEELGIPAMDISVFYDGKEVFRELRGVMDESNSPLTEKTLFNIYSCSKFITCTLALSLLEEGKFSLDDDVADYISAFGDMRVKKCGTLVRAEKRLKLFHLFTMTGGLCYDAYDPQVLRGIEETEGLCPTVKMMDYIAKMPLEFEPGEDWKYSFSHDVIAAIVEIVSGKRFGDFAKERIFSPLGMNNTTFSLPDERLPEVCTQYLYNKDKCEYVNIGKKIRSYKLGSLYESGGAGCVSTVNDYIRFLEAVRTYKIISKDTVDKMKTDYLKDSQRPSCWVSKGYGYGLGVRTPDSTKRRTDFGWNGAAGAFGAVDVQNKISLYYSQAVLASPARPLQADYIEAAKLDLGFSAYEEEMWKESVNPLAGIY